jgi:hypothetical protein
MNYHGSLIIWTFQYTFHTTNEADFGRSVPESRDGNQVTWIINALIIGLIISLNRFLRICVLLPLFLQCLLPILLLIKPIHWEIQKHRPLDEFR